MGEYLISLVGKYLKAREQAGRKGGRQEREGMEGGREEERGREGGRMEGREVEPIGMLII